MLHRRPARPTGPTGPTVPLRALGEPTGPRPAHRAPRRPVGRRRAARAGTVAVLLTGLLVPGLGAGRAGAVVPPGPAGPSGRAVALAGRALIAHGDAGPGTPGVPTRAWLATPHGGRVPVDGLDARLAGAPVVVTGTLAGGRVHATGAEPLEASRAASLGIATGTPGGFGTVSTAGLTAQAYQARTVRTALILVRFAGEPAAPFSVASAQATMFADTNSVKRFYQDATDGAVTVTGDVLGWYTVDTTAGCDWQQWSAQGQAAATAAGVNMSQYQEVVVAGPGRGSCGFAGIGYLGVSGAYINGAMSVHVIGHEMGHNFGSHHAASWRCTSGGTAVTLSNSCTLDEYGDPYSIMGIYGPGLHDAQQAAQIMTRMAGGVPTGWVTTGSTGTYTLARRHSGTTAQLLRIPRGVTGTSFDLELRSNYGSFDSFAAGAPALTGVMVRLSPTNLQSMEQSKLLDAVPGTSTFSDAPFPVGSSIVDTANNVAITITAVTATNATITVRAGGDVSPPSTPANFGGVAGKTSVALSWTASTDNVGVSAYQVTRNGTVLGTVRTPATTVTGLTPNTAYAFGVRALDAAGNASPTATATVTTLADTSAPSGVGTVRVTAGTTGANVSWTRASDDVGVSGYRLYLDGALAASPTTNGAQLTGLDPQSTHTLAVYALDASGNQGPSSSASFTTTRDTTAPAMVGRLTVTGALGSYTATWAPATDNVGVTGYQVFCGSTLLTTTTDTSWSGVCAVRSTLRVQAYDAVGNLARALSSSALR